jgi:hypothetical protein
MKSIIQTDIYDYCRWNKVKSVSSVLKDNIEIDILYKEGIYLKFAFKHENSDILHTLLDFYYDQYDLDQPIENYNFEQKEKKYNLLQVLQDCTETYDLSEEIEKTLQEYSINLIDDNSSVGDLEEFETDFIEKGNNSQSTTGSNSPEKDDVLKDIITDSSGYLLEKNQIGIVGDKALIHNEEGAYHIFDNINNHEI